MSKRTIVYVDGFNLYYGALRGSPYRWLDLQKYFDNIRPDDVIQTVHYFSALVDGHIRVDQQTHLEDLATLPRVNIILGKYINRPIVCRVGACSLAPKKRVFDRPEEKRTDVNIALQMLDDAYQMPAERIILVSGDSDLAPAVNLVKLRNPACDVVIYVPNNNPNRGAAVELRSTSHRNRNLPIIPMRHALFPATLAGPSGTILKKPSNW